jgi:hypothetical protein
MGNVIGGYEYSQCALHIAHCTLIGRGKGSMKEANLVNVSRHRRRVATMTEILAAAKKPFGD